ncbi:MAG: DUF2236 domain-containing protein [Myxococcales bacterium]|nr:DUF2236 domain-containing protein [Myxococcales bacterium]
MQRSHTWSDEYLNQLRATPDEEADACVRVILDSGRVEQVNALMRALTRNDAVVPEALPPAVARYFEQTAALPAWADPELILAGERLFCRYGLQMLQALLYRSLPECYAGADGAQVLHRSRRITDLTHQRVMETLQFVIDVMSRGGLSPSGRGIRSAQRVRLLHASIRAHLLAQGRWDMSLGTPINQEDTVATLATFSSLVIDSLARLGAELSDDERRAYTHCWNVVGHFMGLADETLLHDHADGMALMAAVRRRHHRRSEAGVALTAALLEFANGLVPGETFDGFNATLLRYLCGDEVADLLDVPPSDWTRVFVRQYRRWVDLKDDVQDLGWLSAKIGEIMGAALIRGLIGCPRAGARPGFDIPASLRENWTP